MTEWMPSLDSQMRIGEFVEEMLRQLLVLLGVDEIITSCEVIDTDPYGAGIVPRYIRVRIHRYYQDVLFRGGFSLVAGDYVHVIHIREGNRYEVLGIGGAGGTTTIAIEDLEGYSRGYMIRGGVYDWEPFDASLYGYMLVGDGTDVNSVPITGDITVDGGGYVEVVGLQGRSIADVPPDDGDFLMWDGSGGQWEPNTIGDGVGFWSETGIGAAAVEVLPVGSITKRFSATALTCKEAGATCQGTTPFVAPGGTTQLLNDGGGNICTLAVAVNGQVTVYRSGGADTYSVRMSIRWV